MKYFTIQIHGFIDFYMLNNKGFHLPETDKKKPVWCQTTVTQERIDKMVEITVEGDIFKHIVGAYSKDPKRMAIAEYKKKDGVNMIVPDIETIVYEPGGSAPKYLGVLTIENGKLAIKENDLSRKLNEDNQ